MLMKTDGGLQVACHIHVIDGDQAGLAHVEFAADGFANLALQQFAHALDVGGRTWSKWLNHALPLTSTVQSFLAAIFSIV